MVIHDRTRNLNDNLVCADLGSAIQTASNASRGRRPTAGTDREQQTRPRGKSAPALASRRLLPTPGASITPASMSEFGRSVLSAVIHSWLPGNRRVSTADDYNDELFDKNNINMNNNQIYDDNNYIGNDGDDRIAENNNNFGNENDNSIANMNNSTLNDIGDDAGGVGDDNYASLAVDDEQFNNATTTSARVWQMGECMVQSDTRLILFVQIYNLLWDFRSIATDSTSITSTIVTRLHVPRAMSVCRAMIS